MRLFLRVDGFEGSAEELLVAVKAGRVALTSISLARLIDEALAQVEGWPLEAKAKAALVLANLIVIRLGLDEQKEEALAPEAREAALQKFADLERIATALSSRVKARRSVIPVPAAPLPRDLRMPRLSPKILRRFVPRSGEPLTWPRLVGFGLREAWRRLRERLFRVKKARFDQLAPRPWGMRAVYFAALLEAAKRGWVTMVQPRSYAPIDVHLADREAGFFEESV